MLNRPAPLQRLSAAFESASIVALTGVRGCGKTTLARQFAQDKDAAFFDLGSLSDLRILLVGALAARRLAAVFPGRLDRREPGMVRGVPARFSRARSSSTQPPHLAGSDATLSRLAGAIPCTGNQRLCAGARDRRHR
jgi:chloramphenicol 3-O-phosphotransferase